MADKRVVFNNEPGQRNNEPRLSHALEDGLDPNNVVEAPAGMKSAQKNSNTDRGIITLR